MKSRLIAVICVIVMTAYGAEAQNKIGYINSLELLSYMPEIKKADSTLKLLADDMQKQYDTYLQEYQIKLDDYNKNSATWSPVKREATEQDLLAMQDRIGNYQQTSQDKMQNRKQELYDPVVARANTAIQEIGKEQKLTAILDTSSGAVIFVGDDMINILPMVKTKLNLN